MTDEEIDRRLEKRKQKLIKEHAELPTGTVAWQGEEILDSIAFLEAVQQERAWRKQFVFSTGSVKISGIPAAELSKASGYYGSIRSCHHCEMDTLHRCKDSGHERDSSQDYQECKLCGWWKLGMDGEYRAPIEF